MNWKQLQGWEAEGVLQPLDVHYAKRAAHHAGGATEDVAAVLATTMAAARMGQLYLDRTSLAQLFPTISPQLLESGFTSLKHEKEKWQRFLHQEEDRVYLPKNWQLEQSVIFHLARLSGKRAVQERVHESQLNKKQQEAVETVLHNHVTLLTGGPGTGKTFTAAAIARAFPHAKKIILAAFTARAAEHLKTKILMNGIESSRLSHAGTLHKLLGQKALQSLPEIPWIEADLVVIDESSMIDAPLFAALLASLVEGCTLVFMGDPDQLHPVGIGSIFSDLVHKQISVSSLGRAHLTQCVRVEDQPLLALATAVKHDQPCEWPLLDWSMEIQNKEEFYKQIIHFTQPFWLQPSPHVPSRDELLASLSGFRILSALRQGPFGTETLNERLSHWLQTQAKLGDYWIAPIQITCNDKLTGLCNGEMGLFIQKKNSSESYAVFASCEDKLPAGLLPSYEYAFCISVHKSQGSEYQEVLLIIPPGSEIFGKAMLYTGITRAKKKLSIASTLDILSQCQRKR